MNCISTRLVLGRWIYHASFDSSTHTTHKRTHSWRSLASHPRRWRRIVAPPWRLLSSSTASFVAGSGGRAQHVPTLVVDGIAWCGRSGATRAGTWALDVPLLQPSSGAWWRRIRLPAPRSSCRLSLIYINDGRYVSIVYSDYLMINLVHQFRRRLGILNVWAEHLCCIGKSCESLLPPKCGPTFLAKLLEVLVLLKKCSWLI
jgi:hypothetical protein